MFEKRTATLQAETEPLELDLDRLAVINIDMQNAFVSQGGMFDLLGVDIGGSRQVIQPIKNIMTAARAQKIKVVHIAHRLNPDLVELGPVSIYNCNRFVQSWRDKPEWRDRMILRGTWGAEIIEELQPLPDEIVVEKPRYSAFAGTNLDEILRTFDIRYLIFTGVATNVCVESSIRYAYHLEYFPVLVADASAAAPPERHESSIANIKQCFGRVTTTEEVLKVMGY